MSCNYRPVQTHMKKFLKIYSFRNLVHSFPKQNYCVYRHILSTFPMSKSVCKCVQDSFNHFSTVTSPQYSSEDNAEELRKEFTNPKSIFFQVLNEAFLKDQTLDLKPSITIEQLPADSNNRQLWKIKLHMKWPETFEIESLANRKSDGLNICFLKACQKLKEMGVLDHSNKFTLQRRKFSEEDLKSAKGDLLNLFHRIWHRSGKKEYIPKFNTVQLSGLYGKYWQSELQFVYPEKKVFKAVGLRSTTAETMAAYEALSWLTELGVTDKKRRLIEYTKSDEIKLKENHLAPYSICIPPNIQNQMSAVLKDIEELKTILSSNVPEFEDPCKEIQSEDIIVKDIITNNPVYQLTDQQLIDRSRYLSDKNKFLGRKLWQKLSDIKNEKSSLPIYNKREEILKLIDENQVVVLSGDTGCGKSTQVPQYILDWYISNMKGAECNIVVTQPRRLSAVSIAERVAKERDEKVGDVIGYQIRFNKCLPQGNGAILYCTTGILLRKILSNPSLQGLSHIIIDEVHERNIEIDILLILIKNILENNKKIKLILMSASFNTSLFANYFNTSAVLHVPGKMYPVEEYFLEDLVNDIPTVKNKAFLEPFLDPNLIADAINHIHKTEKPGAILCFLPGWQEIRDVHNKLLEDEENSKSLDIRAVHSKLPHNEQKYIFLPPPVGQRKVILATNIAETSLTIDDVVYVVNSGLHKGTLLDLKVGIASLHTQWITKANVRQRKGRAGRVRPGKCYHLFSWRIFMKMEEYPVPEILRMPLESVILDCKLFSPEAKAKEFLSKALQSPEAIAVENGVQELQALGVLDENESLTYLGDIVAHLSTHPRLAVALVFATFLRCLDPVLTICSILTLENDPFTNSLDDKLLVRKVKENYDNGLCSDHLALTKIIYAMNCLREESDIAQFIEKNSLDDQILTRISQLKEFFSEELYTNKLVESESLCCDYSSQFNIYSSHAPTVLAALTAAFYPNVVKILQGEIFQGKLNKNVLTYSIIKGQKGFIQKESVVSDKDELPSPWLIYFSALKSEVRRKAMLSAVSSVPGICLLLFGGRDVAINVTNERVDGSNSQGNIIVLSIDNNSKLLFSCTDKEAHLLLEWRKVLQELFQLYIKKLQLHCDEKEYLVSSYEKFLPVLKELLNAPQVPFTKGQSYEFVNNELIAKELWDNC